MYECVVSIQVALRSIQWRELRDVRVSAGSIKAGTFLDQLSIYRPPKVNGVAYI